MPIGAGVVARFANNIVGDQVINLDLPITLGSFFIGDADGSHSFLLQDGLGGPLTFNSATGAASLDKSGSADDTIAATMVLQTDSFVTNNAAGFLTLRGNISGSGGLTKLGAGWLALEGADTFSGKTVVGGRTLALGAAASLASTPLLDVKSDAVLDVTALAGGWPLATNQTLSGSGSVIGDVSVLAGGTVTPGGQGAAGALTLAVTGAIPSGPVLQVDAGALLDVPAVTGGFILGPGQTLRGNGVVFGNFNALGTLAPGASIGRLICSNSVTLAGNLVMETSKIGSTITDDALLVGGTLTLGGNLTVTHAGNAPAAGDTFPLFTAANLGGNFAIANLPALMAGLRWDSSLLATDGKLRVAAITPPMIQPVSFDGTNLLLQVGSETGVAYVLEATPSLDAPVYWTAIATNSGTGGLLNFPISVSAEPPQQFFRMATY